MTTIITATDATQFLALVPAMLGYTPTRSVVLIPFDGGRSCGGMRLDLPEGDVEAAAATMIGLVCRLPRADAVAIAVFTDEEPAADDPGSRPHRVLVEALRIRAGACGITVREALRAGPVTWDSYLDDAAPRPVSQLRVPPAAAGFAPPPGDQSTGGGLPKADAGRRKELRRSLALLDRALRTFTDPPKAAPSIDPAALGALLEVAAPVPLFEAALRLDPDDPPLDQAAALVWLLTTPGYRGIALIQWATDIDGGIRAQQAEEVWRDEGTYDETVGEQLWGIGPRPDPARLHVALALTRRLAADAPAKRRASLLAVCAWLAWALGRSTHAARFAADALALDADLVIAELVAQFVSTARLPEWAFDPAGGTT